jgi:protoporphyrinogen oxidase
LCRLDQTSTILEADSVVGGISRTVECRGFRFDVGGHRFYTKVPIIAQLWSEILGDDFLIRPRLSRIYYDGKFFDYPLKARNVLSNLGLWEATRCVISYVYARLFPSRPETSLESWVINRFGRRLYRMFFKSYTEKVWGVPCSDIQAEWAAQRIRGLSMISAALDAINPFTRRTSGLKTLTDTFHYPRLGPGMLWDRVADTVTKQGTVIHRNMPVERIFWEVGRVTGVQAGGKLFPAEHVLSSMPIRDLILALDPAPPDWLLESADCFHYRDFLTVALVLRKSNAFPDNWIYIHDSRVKVGRIQNFKNWSPEMVPSDEYTCLGLEYFCFEGDDLWTMSDQDLISKATAELRSLKLDGGGEVVDGSVVRMAKAYPVYDRVYRRGIDAIRRFLAQVPNLQLIGRNGMHHYNNQDHSMLTGLLAARNVMGGSNDLWRVNVDSEYLEEGAVISNEELDALRATQPRVPQRIGGSAA